MRTYTITNLNTDDQVTADDHDHDEMDHPPADFDADDWRLEYFGLEITTTAAELPAA